MEVVFKSFRRLVGDFESILQNTNWEDRWRDSGEPEPEVRMAVDRSGLKKEFKLGHPTRHQMAILE